MNVSARLVGGAARVDYLGRGVPGDLTRAHHVIEGDDERRLRAGSEEGLEALDGIALP